MGHNYGAGAEDCYVCGKRAGYNRAIVESRREIEVGRICVNCERDELDEQFVSEESSDGTCAYCERQGGYRLPRYEPAVIETDDAVVLVVSSKLDSAPIRLCERHLARLAASERDDTDDRTVHERRLVS
jgi:hypothetical protein